MLSFISNSKQMINRSVRNAVAFLLIAACLSLAAVEAVTRVGFDRISRIQSRMRYEWESAVKPPKPNQLTVLIVGNSLLGTSVIPEILHSKLIPAVDARRLVVEDTRYFDWYYGLRRLFSEGCKPNIIAVMLNERQLTDQGIRGDYSARYLIGLVDIPAVNRSTGADRNRACGMFLANISAFWGAREEIRKWLLGIVMPGVPEWMSTLARRPVEQISVDRTETLARERILELKRLVAEHGAILWIIVPATGGGYESTQLLQRAGEKTGVKVLVPVPPGQLGPDYFEDGFHVNKRGAEVFTLALLNLIRSQ